MPFARPAAAPDPWELPRWQLPLAQLCDSALPIGAFSHSMGLETYVQEEIVRDADSFLAWLTVLVTTQLCYADALAIREAYRTHDADNGDAIARIWDLDRLLFAQTAPAQVREANRAMAARTLTIAQATAASPHLDRYRQQIDQGRCYGHPAIVIALVGAELVAPVGVVIAAHLFSVATTLTQNAVRVIPLGQTAGQRVLQQIRPVIASVVKRAEKISMDDFGAIAFGVELAQMRHERVRARMFMS